MITHQAQAHSHECHRQILVTHNIHAGNTKMKATEWTRCKCSRIDNFSFFYLIIFTVVDACNILGNVISGGKANIESSVWQVAFLSREKQFLRSEDYQTFVVHS